MTPQQIALSGVVSLLGLIVLVTYYICFTRLQEPSSYASHPMWFDMPKAYIYLCIVLQIAAVIGFFVFFIDLVRHPSTRGILSYVDGYAPTIILATFLISSIVWPIATTYKYKTASVLSLVIAAIASLLLLAGVTEDRKPLSVVIATVIFCIVTVLQDGVIWNANYLIQ
jgi:hypothetical protein